MNRSLHILRIIIVLLATALLSSHTYPLAASGFPDAPVPPDGRGDERISPHTNMTTNLTSTGWSPVPAPAITDSSFVTDEGPMLDVYLFRYDVPNGRLSFDIPIDRYYSDLLTYASLDENGFLLKEVRDNLVSKYLLPPNATLTLEVYDVDHEALVCAEVDYVYINGKQLQDPRGGPATLTSGDSTWSTWSISFPIEYLKFPYNKGMQQRPTAITNTVEIEIDVMCLSNWAVEVDWGQITIPSPVRPLVFVHGWTGTENAFLNFFQYARAEGIPAAQPRNYNRMIYPIPNTAPSVATEINKIALEYGVDKVNVFAHSKGGLVSRYALRDSTVATRVERLITFGSPHHGTIWAEVLRLLPEYRMLDPEYAIFALCANNLDTLDPTDLQLCFNSTQEFSTDQIRDKFNYQNCEWRWWPLPSRWVNCSPRYIQQPNVKYMSFATVKDEAVVPSFSSTYPWKANAIPFPYWYNVDALYLTLSHGGIKEDRDVYECAINYLDPRIHSAAGSCPLLNTGLETANAANDLQTVYVNAGPLAAGQNETSNTFLDGTPLAVFRAGGTAALEFSLVSPTGQVIDPAAAAADPSIEYTVVEESLLGWTYTYAVNGALGGQWQHRVRASSDLDYWLWDQVESEVVLEAATDSSTYAPGNLVTFEAALMQAGIPNTTAAIQGTVYQPDGSQMALTFYDDGTNGDITAADGIQTTRFTAASVPGNADISLSASLGNLARQKGSSFTIAGQTAEILGVILEQTIDANINTLIDTLQLDMTIQVNTEGEFDVSGTLVDPHGNTITSDMYSSRFTGTGPLAIGTHTLPLRFSGNEIYKNGVDGPYILTNVSIMDVTGTTMEVNRATNLYFTAPYSYNQFERSLLSFVSGVDNAIDTNLNGRYDRLDIAVNVDVVFPGTYSWNGRLLDARGAEIGWYVGTGWLDNSTPLYFSFDGQRVGENGEDGPYYLSNVTVFKTDGGTVSITFDQLYTTDAYNYLDFEGGIPKVYFSLPEYTFPEDAGLLPLTVTLNSEWNLPITVDFASRDGTGVSGVDYTLVSGVLTFEPGDLTHVIELPVLDNSQNQLHRTLYIDLSNPNGANLGLNSTVLVTIMDDDGPDAYFDLFAVDVYEDAGSVNVKVKLSFASLNTVHVDYWTSDGTAVSGSDYITAQGTLSFAPGEMEKTFAIYIQDDAIPETDEELAVNLGNPQDAYIGAPNTLMVTILDDDFYRTLLPIIVK